MDLRTGFAELLKTEELTCPKGFPNIDSVMENQTPTYKELELVKLLSEAIDELNQIGCDDIANDLQEKLENLLNIEPVKKMTFTYYDDETKTEVTKDVNF